jgi:ParB-like chromosome segregation protein Spo0J
MQKAAYTALVESIRSQGLLDAIELTADGRIVDGWHRYQACSDAGQEHRYVALPTMSDVEIADHINAKKERQDYTKAQRATARMKMTEYLDSITKKAKDAAKQRKKGGRPKKLGANGTQVSSKRNPRASDEIAKELGVGRKAYEQLVVVQVQASDLFEQVHSGKISINKAHKQTIARARTEPPPPVRRDQPAPERKPPSEPEQRQPSGMEAALTAGDLVGEAQNIVEHLENVVLESVNSMHQNYIGGLLEQAIELQNTCSRIVQALRDKANATNKRPHLEIVGGNTP